MPDLLKEISRWTCSCVEVASERSSTISRIPVPDVMTNRNGFTLMRQKSVTTGKLSTPGRLVKPQFLPTFSILALSQMRCVDVQRKRRSTDLLGRKWLAPFRYSRVRAGPFLRRAFRDSRQRDYGFTCSGGMSSTAQFASGPNRAVR
jgi:hypothetical protein